MKITLSAPQMIGGKSYAKGEHTVSDSLSYNIGFKSMVKNGAVRVLPRDANEQKIQMSRDIKEQQKAKAARRAIKDVKSAQAASSASSQPSSAAQSALTIPSPAMPISAGAVVAPANAQKR